MHEFTPSIEMLSPRVSVVMPTYNAAAFVSRAVASVRAQTFTQWELLVVDDRSTDSTLAVLQALASEDARIRVISQDQNRGPGVARNRGFDEAQGVWIAILDADDAYLPDRLATLVAAAETRSLDMVADPLQYYDFGAKRVARTWRAPADAPEFTLRGLFDSQRRASNSYATLKPLFRRSFLNDKQLRYRPTYRYGEDFILYADALVSGAQQMIDSAHYLYTMPLGTISKSHSGQSKTVKKGREFLAQLEAFRLEHHARLTAEELDALNRCYDERLRHTMLGEFKAQLSNRQLGAALGNVLKRPAILMDLKQFVSRKRLARRG